MKKRIILVDKENVKQTIEEMDVFSYSLLDKSNKGKKVKLTFIREKEISDELLTLEEEYHSLRIPSFKPLIILMVITFVLLTALLVGVLLIKDESIKDIYIYALGIPSAISFIALSGYYYFRTARMNKFISGGDKLRQGVINKAKELKDESNR